MRKYFHYWLAILLFLVYFFTYQDILSHVIYYHEQHQLFLYTADYFQHHDLLSYMTAFWIQFFYYPVLGSALMAFILTAIYLLTWWILKTIIHREDILRLSLLPSLALYLWTASLEHTLKPLIAFFLLLVAIALAVRLLWKRQDGRNFDFSKKKFAWITAVVLAIYTSGAVFGFLHSFSVSEFRMVKAEQAMDHKDWDQVLKHTDHYLAYRQKNNPLMFYFRNIALYHKGMLLDHIFDYPPVMGVNALYFPWRGKSRECEYGHYLLEELGCINDAQHWEFETMVIGGETAPRLINLAKYAIMNGRKAVAEHFILRLRQSLFYRKEAEKLQSYLALGRVPGMKAPLARIKENKANFINILNIGPNLQYLLKHDPHNKMAYEYLMCDLLLSNNLQRFIQNLPTYTQFGYATMPKIVEEALLIAELGGLDTKGIKVSGETRQRFDTYYQQISQGIGIGKEYSNTYWYYINYISPYGNKIKK